MSIFSPKKKKSKIGGDTYLLSNDSPFAVQEAYKALRTNVIFSLPGQSSKCIGITSAAKGTGKSTTALNLAISFAQIDKKVIVIDCDLRLPTVASKLAISGEPGISNMLIGSCRLGDVIQHIPDRGIDIIPSGTIPPDATRLLASEEMKQLVQVLKQCYDYIFVDLPPVLLTPDATIISGLIDGFLLVTRHNVSEFRATANMLAQMKFAGANLLGFVYNRADTGGKRSYGKYGYYGK